MKNEKVTLLAGLFLFGISGFGQELQSTYHLVKDANQLEVGAIYLIASDKDSGDNTYVLSYNNGNNRRGVQVDMQDGAIVTIVASNVGDESRPYELQLGGKKGAWTFYDAVNEAYLNVTNTTSSNALQTIAKVDTYSKFSIAISSENIAIITATGKKTRNLLRYNKDATLFSCYDSGQNNVFLYKKVDNGDTPDPGITVSVPTISLSTGTYYEEQTVSIEADEGCSVYYTIDGTSPTTSSMVYENPIIVSETTTIKAIAVDVDGNISAEVTAVITITERKPDATFSNPYTYNEVTSLEKLPTKSVWIKGYIVGYIGGDGILSTNFNNLGSQNKSTTLGIGSLDAQGTQFIPINLTDSIKPVLNADDNRYNLNREIRLYGVLEKSWGRNGMKEPTKAICKDTSFPYGYIIAGKDFKDEELDFVFSDENVTSVDLRCCADDVSEKKVLNPNALIIGNSIIEDVNNVVVKSGSEYVCQKLVLNNGHAFRAPFNFVANEAVYTMKISAAGYATLCLPFACPVPEGLTAYNLLSINGKEIIGVEVDVLEANKPVLIKGSQGEYVFSAEKVEVCVAEEDMVNGVLKGVYSTQSVTSGNYVLQMHGDEPAFYIVAAGKEPTVTSFRAYMLSALKETNMFTLKIVNQSEIDNIDDVIASKQLVKREFYNIYGGRLSALEKGLNIVRMSDGSVKKIFVK